MKDKQYIFKYMGNRLFNVVFVIDSNYDYDKSFYQFMREESIDYEITHFYFGQINVFGIRVPTDSDAYYLILKYS
jgi:hypothetical protein